LRTQVGIKQVLVLTVTLSALRVLTMVEPIKALTGGAGSNVFLFTAAEEIEGKSPLDIRLSLRERGVRLARAENCPSPLLGQRGACEAL
jgi:hypothetical protein